MNDNTNPLAPHSELLWKAVNWIAEQGNSTPPVIEEASIRYNLSPKDEEFLMRHFLRQPRE
jgi:hypothetical protein